MVSKAFTTVESTFVHTRTGLKEILPLQRSVADLYHSRPHITGITVRGNDRFSPSNRP